MQHPAMRPIVCIVKLYSRGVRTRQERYYCETGMVYNVIMYICQVNKKYALQTKVFMNCYSELIMRVSKIK